MLGTAQQRLLTLSLLRRRPSLWAQSGKVYFSNLMRTLSSTPSTRQTISSILSKVARTHPLKDAAKFFETTNNQVLIWTYSDLQAHVDALANGLAELGYSKSDRIALWIPAGSAEYVTTMLAGAKLGIGIVVVETDKGVDEVKDAVNKYKAKGLIIWHGFGDGESDLVEKIIPGLKDRDAKGLAGFSQLSGKELNYEDMSSLKHIVHTGSENVRGALCFRNLMVYNPARPADEAKSKDTVFIEASSGKGVTEEQLMDEANKMGSTMKLTAQHETKNGKVVIPGQSRTQTAAAYISALIHESLLVSPSLTADKEKTKNVAESENAVVFS